MARSSRGAPQAQGRGLWAGPRARPSVRPSVRPSGTGLGGDCCSPLRFRPVFILSACGHQIKGETAPSSCKHGTLRRTRGLSPSALGTAVPSLSTAGSARDGWPGV